MYRSEVFYNVHLFVSNAAKTITDTISDNIDDISIGTIFVLPFSIQNNHNYDDKDHADQDDPSSSSSSYNTKGSFLYRARYRLYNGDKINATYML